MNTPTSPDRPRSESPQPKPAPKPASQEYPQAYAALPVNNNGSLCPHTGLRHAHLAKLLRPGGLAAGYVRVVALKEPGARHGKTLFHIGDMLRWLDFLASTQAMQRQEVAAVNGHQPEMQG